MAVNLPNSNWTNVVGQHMTDLRDALTNLLQDAEYLAAMGGVGFLTQPPFNMGAADAAAFNGVLSEVVATNPTVEAIQAFIESTAPFWGGN